MGTGMGMQQPMRISPYMVGAGSSSSYNLPINPLQSGMILPSDNSIDENEYVIGAGDVFFITAVESSTIKYTAAVDQTGKAYIQNVGLVQIGKVSYAEAKKIISEYISSKLKNPSGIYVTLVQTKNAIVSFTGEIRSPGSYELPGIMRLLDAIRIANDGELPLPAETDLRQVHITNGDSVAVYDLLAYLYMDDQSQNPYVYPGDRIRANPTTAKVFIAGPMKAPLSGFYPIKEGETLKAFLSMFTFDNTADTNKVIIFQSSDNSKKVISDPADMYHVLNDLDAITVPVKKNHPGIHSVHIWGEVASPGSYPIIENSTSARQLIEAAGGIKETGFADQAVIIRPVKNLPEPFSAGAAQMNAVRPERGVSIHTASTSQDYTVIRIILYNADKIILEPGDEIVIPKKDKFVYISGSVKNPGAYPFLMGKDYGYYVTQAGGFAKNADKSNIQIYLKYGNVVQNIEPRCIEPGSVIVVPVSTQYRFLTQVILPLISTLATTLGVGLAIYNSRQ
jgi:protein involved in polysaccharide export with SLBB domain